MCRSEPETCGVWGEAVWGRSDGMSTSSPAGGHQGDERERRYTCVEMAAGVAGRGGTVRGGKRWDLNSKWGKVMYRFLSKSKELKLYPKSLGSFKKRRDNAEGRKTS